MFPEVRELEVAGLADFAAVDDQPVVTVAAGSDLSCSSLVTTPAEVVEEGPGLGGDAGLGGHLLGADGDSG